MMRRLIVTILAIGSLAVSANAQYRLDEQSYSVDFTGKQMPSFNVNEWIPKEPKIKGKYGLVDFWGIFAYPCTSLTVPQLNRLAKEFKKELVVIGYSIDDAFYVRQLETPVFGYPIGTVDFEEIQKIFEFDGLPVTLLINPEGKVIWQGSVLLPDVPLSDKNIYFLSAAKLRSMIDADKLARNKR